MKNTINKIIAVLLLLTICSVAVTPIYFMGKYIGSELVTDRMSLNITAEETQPQELSYTLYYHTYNANGDYVLETQPVYGDDAVITFRDRPAASENPYVADREFIGWLLSGIDEVTNNSSMIRYGSGTGMTNQAIASDLYYRQKGPKYIKKTTTNETTGETTTSWTSSGESFQPWTDEQGNKVIHLFDVYKGPVLRAEVDDADTFVSDTTYGAGHFDVTPGIEIYSDTRKHTEFEQYYDNTDGISRFYYLKSKDAYYEFYFHPGMYLRFTEVAVTHTLDNGSTNYEKKSYMRDADGNQMIDLYLEDKNYTFYSYNPTPSNATPKNENSGTGCFTADTLITLADGNQKTVEALTENDILRVYDHENGEYVNSPILFIEYDGDDDYNVINLEFSDGTHSKFIYDHGLFDLDLMKYVYISEKNCTDYIGHRFAKAKAEGYDIVTLENAYLKTEYTGCYSLTTNYHLNYFVDGMFSMPAGIYGLFNFFEYDEDLKYDEAKKQTDIEKYGLYTAEDFSEYLPEAVFNEIFPTKYLKVSVGKGLIDFEGILRIIERYIVGHNLFEKFPEEIEKNTDEEPVDEEPAKEEPAEEEPAEEEPAEAEPIEKEPVDEEPAKEEPAEEEPAEEEPAKAEPVEEEPTKEEPTKEEPAEEEPAEEEPVEEEPVDEEPAEEEPVEEEPAKEEPIEEVPAKDEPAEAEPIEKEPVDEEPAKEEPTKEEPAKAEPTKEEPIEEENQPL